MPRDLLISKAPAPMRSFKTKDMPLIVMAIPAQACQERDSLRTAIAARDMNPGVSVPKSDIRRGPRLTRARKKKVSPRVMPINPLSPSRRTVERPIWSRPVQRSAIKRYPQPSTPLQRFMLSGEMVSPIFFQSTEPQANEADESNAAQQAITKGGIFFIIDIRTQFSSAGCK